MSRLSVQIFIHKGKALVEMMKEEHAHGPAALAYGICVL